MLKFSEIFEFSRENKPKIPILKEFEWFEWFEWFGPSPIEPFNSGQFRVAEQDFASANLRVFEPAPEPHVSRPGASYRKLTAVAPGFLLRGSVAALRPGAPRNPEARHSPTIRVCALVRGVPAG